MYEGFRLFAYGKDKDKYQIRLRVTFNGQRIDLSTGCQINSIDAWNPKLEVVRSWYSGPRGETATSINGELHNIKDQMDTTFKYFEAIDKIPTPSEVIRKYKERLGVLFLKGQPLNPRRK